MGNIIPAQLKSLEGLINYIPSAFIVLDKSAKVLFKNNAAEQLFGKFTTIQQIEHKLLFEAYAINEDMVVEYNPIFEVATNPTSLLSIEATVQLSASEYKKYKIISENNGDFKTVLFVPVVEEDKIQQLEERINNLNLDISILESDRSKFSKLKEKAEAQAIRAALISRISSSIRDSLNIAEILQTALSEITGTLGLKISAYAAYNEESSNFALHHTYGTDEIQDYNKILTRFISAANSSIDIFSKSFCFVSDDVHPGLISPVILQNRILGVMLLYPSNNKKFWHPDEISLVNSISAQLAVAVSQADLFHKIENNNIELAAAIEQLKQTQAQLIQSEKMASLGQLVAGVAHEINTPLGAISSNRSMISKCFEKIKAKAFDIPELKIFFSTIDELSEVNNEAINRINNIVKTLRNFARLDEAELKEVDIHEGIRSTLTLINHEIKHRIDIVEEYGNIPKIFCYPNLLNQVLMNLLVNAYQSIDKTGTISIRTSIEGHFAKICISDTGKGINKNNLSKIFDPGFTTKGVGVGTGLGLSICYQIMEKHKGKILVDSTEGVGTTFSVLIPVSVQANCKEC